MSEPLTRYQVLKELVKLQQELRGIVEKAGTNTPARLFEVSPRALGLSREIAMLTAALDASGPLRLESNLELLAAERGENL